MHLGLELLAFSLLEMRSPGLPGRSNPTTITNVLPSNPIPMANQPSKFNKADIYFYFLTTNLYNLTRSANENCSASVLAHWIANPIPHDKKISRLCTNDRPEIGGKASWHFI